MPTFRRLIQLSSSGLKNEKVTNLQSFLLSTTYLFHYILFILTLGICTDIQLSSPHISCIFANKALPFLVTLPAPFLITFILTRQVIDFSKDLELRGDKFRDLKKRKHYFSKSKIVTNFSSIQTCSLCPKQVFKMLPVIRLLTQKKNILGLLE